MSIICSAILTIVLCAGEEPTVITYDAPGGAPVVDTYQVTVNGKPLAVYQADVWNPGYTPSYGGPYGFCSFDFTGEVKVEVTVQRPLARLLIQPESRRIKASVEGQTIRFRLEHACQLSIEPDGKNGPLLLFANPLEANRPKPEDPNVKWFGPGLHEAGAIELKSGQTLYLAGGAFVKGGLRASGTNIVICGRGILDGSSYARFKGPTRHMVSLDGCTNVVVEGIILRDGWGWTLVPAACDGVEIANVKICSARCENADGIDIVNSRNVTIRDCFIRTDDDCIAPKGMGLSNGQAVENILVKDSVLWTDKAHIWRIGCESRTQAMRHIVSENVDVLHFCDAWFDNENGHGPLAITLQPAEDMLMEDIRFENIRIHGEGQKLLLEVKPQVTIWAKLKKPGRIRNVLFKNFHVTGTTDGPLGRILVTGPDAEHSVTGVRFENVTRYGQLVSENSPEVIVTGHASDIVFSAARRRSLAPVPERPFTNSQGMEFLPAGTPNVLVSRWETRVQDFAAFVKTTGYDAFSESTDGKRPFTLEADSTNASGYDWKQAGGSWQDPHFLQTPKHPATCVSYHDAQRFCAWLTRHEADQGTLPSGWRYRLPTDEEWTRAAGAVEYPWGDHWPPTAHDGNYCGTESRIGFTDTPKWKCLEIFRDSHPRTAPVGSYPSNAFGLFDMGGNVWEWCSTWYQTNLNQADLNDPAIVQGFPALLGDGGGRQNRVVRGGSWHAQRQVDMRTRFRGIGDPHIRFDDFGFRCVLAREDTTPAEWPEAPGPKPAARREHIQYFAPMTWPSSPPPDGPFEPSEDIAAIRFTGVHSDYRIADTWYPTWAADGNLYSPYTDGWVNQDSANSDGYELVNGPAWGSHGVTRRKATTGQAVMVGDDPLNLTISSLGTSQADPYPYGGRYPCGSLVYKGVWYYGTYCLAPHGSTLFGGTIYNWPWLGPFVGFRTSTDMGRTWQETPWTPDKPLFGENGLWGYPVKIGAPHFVDYGKELAHSPDGKAYLVAHGAVHPDPKPRFANLSWITGDQIYLLRVEPSLQNMNDAAQYEFYGGHDEQGIPIWTRDFKRIKPLLEWNNNMGCVTVTYNAPLKKYFMCVTDGGNTCARMNTYILESSHLTGPWRLVTYMNHFGEQAYFVNIPSKFISPDGTKAWLCYSANFAANWNNEKIGSNPPGSRYGLVFQEIQFLDPAAKKALERNTSTTLNE